MPQKASGTTISCRYNNAQVMLGSLRSVSEIRFDSESLDVTTLDSAGGYRQYTQGLKDMGEITLEGFFERAQEGQNALRALYESGAVTPFTVTFPDRSAVTFSAFVKSHALGAAEVDQVVGFTAVLRVCGGAVIA